MQLCQNARIMGRVSILAGAPSSNETAKRNVGPISRIARNPAHVISHSKNLRHQLYGRPWVDAPLETGEVAAAFTRVLYRSARGSSSVSQHSPPLVSEVIKCAGMPANR